MSGLQIIKPTNTSSVIFVVPSTDTNSVPGSTDYNSTTQVLSIQNTDGTSTPFQFSYPPPPPPPISGLKSINGVTSLSQVFDTLYPSNVLGIVDNGSTHTYNFTDASQTIAGFLNNSTQTFSGQKIFGNIQGIDFSLNNCTINDITNNVIAKYLVGVPTFMISPPPTNGQVLVFSNDISYFGNISSTGNILSLNGLTAVSQIMRTGTSGNDFNIVSSGDTHTFNIPNASATARGFMSNGSQTIAGDKTFTGVVMGNCVNSNFSSATNTISVKGLSVPSNTDITIPDNNSAPLVGQVLSYIGNGEMYWEPTSVISNPVINSFYTSNGSSINVVGTPSNPQINNTLIQSSPTTAAWSAMNGNLYRTRSSQNYWAYQYLGAGNLSYQGNVNIDFGSIVPQFATFTSQANFGYTPTYIENLNSFTSVVFNSDTFEVRNCRVDLSTSVYELTPTVDVGCTYSLDLFVNNAFASTICKFTGRSLLNNGLNSLIQVSGFAGIGGIQSGSVFEVVLSVTGSDNLPHILQFSNVNYKITVLTN